MNRRLRRSFLQRTSTVAAVVATMLACGTRDSDRPTEEPLPPLVTSLDTTGRIRIEFGRGSLRTTNTVPWRGTDSASYPLVIERGTSPVVVEVIGLYLSGIGDLIWPPDTADAGAVVDLILGGPHSASVRMYSTLVHKRFLVRRQAPGSDVPTWRRDFVFEGRNGAGWFGRHRFRSERGDSARAAFETFDLRVQYDHRSMSAWVRRSASSASDSTRPAAHRECPRDPAMNVARVNRGSRMPDAVCFPWGHGDPEAKPGKWLAVGTREWDGQTEPVPIELLLTLRNWFRAAGPYIVAWENIIVTGKRESTVPTAIGKGEFVVRATGALATLTTLNEAARFSLIATGADEEGVSRAAFRFRAGDFELAARGTSWIHMHSSGLSLGGAATVNDLQGYRYVVNATNALNDRDRDQLKIDVLSAANAYTVPVFSAVAVLPASTLNLWFP